MLCSKSTTDENKRGLGLMQVVCYMLLKRDPVDEDVPYCTLKSFPAVIDHCIEWARDKVF